MARRLSIGDYHVGPYCGDRFWSFHSWSWWLKKYGIIRTTTNGFSIGPVLFWKERIK